MSNVSQLHDRNRPPAQRIGTEEDAPTVARDLALHLAPEASRRDIERRHALEGLALLCAGGLLGVTVPAEAGGIDLSNGTLCDMITLLAESDSSVADLYCSHLQVLETLRWEAGEAQQALYFERALQGELFALCPARQAAVTLSRGGAQHRAEGRARTRAGVLFADWIMVTAKDGGEGERTLLVNRQADGLTVIDDWDAIGQRTAGGGTVVLQNMAVGNEAIVSARATRPATSVQAFGDLVHAAVDLGIARAAFCELNHAPGGEAAEAGWKAPAATLRRGRLAARLETAAAMIERAARLLDIAQVNADAGSIEAANLAATVARLEATQAAAQLGSGLLDDLGEDGQRIDLNRDRHWRNARAHAPADSDALPYRLGSLYALRGLREEPLKDP